jgi:hypothetical protein
MRSNAKHENKIILSMTIKKICNDIPRIIIWIDYDQNFDTKICANTAEEEEEEEEEVG